MVTGSMSRLEALWEWQGKKKKGGDSEAGKGKTKKTTKKSTAAAATKQKKQGSIPRYMQSTISVSSINRLVGIL